MSILQHQTDSVRGVLNHAISKAATVMDATPNLNPAKQILRVGSQKSQYDAETNKAMLSELIKNLEFAKLSLRKETPLIQIIDSPSYPLDKDRVSRSISLILGGLIGGFLAIGYLSIGRFIKNAMA
jgi:LPS O-antigen subunit length determinant protein (WzzB/FepE family)